MAKRTGALLLPFSLFTALISSKLLQQRIRREVPLNLRACNASESHLIWEIQITQPLLGSPTLDSVCQYGAHMFYFIRRAENVLNLNLERRYFYYSM